MLLVGILLTETAALFSGSIRNEDDNSTSCEKKCGRIEQGKKGGSTLHHG